MSDFDAKRNELEKRVEEIKKGMEELQKKIDLFENPSDGYLLDEDTVSDDTYPQCYLSGYAKHPTTFAENECYDCTHVFICVSTDIEQEPKPTEYLDVGMTVSRREKIYVVYSSGNDVHGFGKTFEESLERYREGVTVMENKK